MADDKKLEMTDDQRSLIESFINRHQGDIKKANLPPECVIRIVGKFLKEGFVKDLRMITEDIKNLLVDGIVAQSYSCDKTKAICPILECKCSCFQKNR